MTILCLGLSFRTASIELREQLSLSRSAAQSTLQRFCSWRDSHMSPDAELAVLSTCNRLELYLAAKDLPIDQAASAMMGFIADCHGIAVAAVESHLYRHDQLDAVHHLCAVAAGLDSMVLGESQILGQVGEAIELSLREKAAGTVLSNLFRIAVRAGKRAHTETTLGRNSVSIGSAAIKRAEQEIGHAALQDAKVLVVGAGVMAGLVIRALHARGVRNITIANRTLAHASTLAQRWGAAAFGLADLTALIAQADLVIAATGAPHPVIRLEHAQKAMQSRPHQPLVLLDIAMPRDIEPSVGELHEVQLLNLDNLQSVIDASLSVRQEQIPLAQAIVNDEVHEFDTWMRGAAIHPVIADLRNRAEAIRQRELERALRHLRGLDPETRDYVQGLTHAIVNKILHEPTTRLRAAAHDERAIEYADSVRYLFDLSNDATRNTPESHRR